MTKSNRKYGLAVLLLSASTLLSAQESNPTSSPVYPNAKEQGPSEIRDGVPIYKVQVVGRDIPAINYFHRNGSTKIGFQGTSLLPGAKGSAKVDAKAGRTSIDANFEGLSPANGFGPEYLTYVLWGITPEGRPVNLGEVLPTGSKDKNQITVTTNLQVFGLIVTAEPYFAVTMPSDLVCDAELRRGQDTGRDRAGECSLFSAATRSVHRNRWAAFRAGSDYAG
jgi:hypothetical protein